MHFHLVIYLFILSIFLTNVIVVSIEPITMGIGAAVVGKHKSTYDIIRITMESKRSNGRSDSKIAMY